MLGQLRVEPVIGLPPRSARRGNQRRRYAGLALARAAIPMRRAAVTAVLPVVATCLEQARLVLARRAPTAEEAEAAAAAAAVRKRMGYPLGIPSLRRRRAG